MGTLGRIIGGAMVGLGAGMTEQAKTRREMAMLQLKSQMERENLQFGHKLNIERDKVQGAIQRENDDHRTTNDIKIKGVDHGYRLKESEAEFGQRRALARDEHGYRIGEIGAQGSETRRNQSHSSALDKERSKSEKQDEDTKKTYDRVIARHTSTVPINERNPEDGTRTVVDYKAAAKHFMKLGRPDLAQQVEVDPKDPLGIRR